MLARRLVSACETAGDRKAPPASAADALDQDPLAAEAAREFERIFHKAFREDKNRIKITEDAIVRLHSVHAAAEKARDAGADADKARWKKHGTATVNLSDLKAQAIVQRKTPLPPNVIQLLLLKEMDALLMHAIQYFRCHLKEEKYKRDAGKGDISDYQPMKGSQCALDIKIVELQGKKSRAFYEIAHKYAFMLTSKKLKKLAPPYSEQVPEMRFFEALYDVVLTVIKMVFPSPTSVPIIEKEHGRVFRSRYFNIATHRTPEFAALADKLGPKPEKFDWKTFVDVAEVRPNQEDEAFELGESYTAAAAAGDHVAEDARARTAQEAAPRVVGNEGPTRARPPGQPSAPQQQPFSSPSPYRNTKIRPATAGPPPPDPKSRAEFSVAATGAKPGRPASAPATSIENARARSQRIARLARLAQPKHVSADQRPRKRSFIQQASAARTPLIGSIIADPHEALTRFWKKWTNDKAPSTLTGTLRSYAWQCQEEQRRSDQADETGRQGGTGDEDDENAGGLSEFDRVRVNNDHKRNFDDCLVVNGYPFVPKTRKREPQPFQLHSKAPKSKRAWK